MIRIISEWAGRKFYVAKNYFEAAQAELGSKSAAVNAEKTKALIAQTTKEADDIDARIKEVEAMLEKGYWECESGHEMDAQPPNAISGEKFDGIDVSRPTCKCSAPAKFIKRSTMTGQEQYESDKERKEAEKIVQSKRAEISQLNEKFQQEESSAEFLMKNATRIRDFANRLSKL